MEELLALNEILSKVKSAIGQVKGAADGERERRNREALASIDETAAEVFRRLIGDSVTADALDGFAASHAPTVKPRADVFSDDYRREFQSKFLKQHPAALPCADQCGRAVEAYFDLVEQSLRDNLDAGDRILLRNVVSIHGKLDGISVKQDEANAKLDTLLNRVPPAPVGLHTSNSLYADSFTETLFLHKGRNDKVNLRNLFVPHRFSVVSYDREWRGNSASTLDEYLACLIQWEDYIPTEERRRPHQPPLLLIEGDAGCGKTSLSAYLAWHYENDPVFRREVFGDRPLFTVRLRDLDIPTEKEISTRMARGVLQFLNISVGDLRRRKPVLLLDGYDELCTVSELGDPQAALYHLRDLKCQIILTCRPQYVRTELFRNGKQYDYPYEHIRLEHLDKEQRETLLERYTRNCGEAVAEETLQYIQRIGDDSAESICDTPMGLYMVAARQFDADELENQWALYHRIFSEEQRRTDYNPTYNPPAEENENMLRTEHSAGEHWENIYRLSEEIAWYQYQRRNADLAVPGEAVREALERLGLENEDTKKLLERCFALCGYWKKNPDRGCVEFYHNNIRDFFLCEKIMRELNEGYARDLTEPDGDSLPFLRRLTGLLRYGPLEQRVLVFLRQRAEYNVKTGCPDLCVQKEKESRFLPRLYETLLLRGEPYTVDPDENPIRPVTWILENVFSVFTRLYMSFLNEGEHIRWWTDVGRINENGVFRMAAGQILQYAAFADLRGADLSRVVLTGADLRGAYLTGADLTGAYLTGAQLTGAHLSCAHLSSAHLSSADLSRAHLSRADLSRAHLSRADLSRADLTGADLSRADLTGAYLTGAYLTVAYLSSADLTGAHLFGANLSSAVLTGAVLTGADLRHADLSRADLEDSNLYGANLDGVDLSEARNVPEKYLPKDPPSTDEEM